MSNQIPPPRLLNGATVHGLLGQRGIRHPAELILLGVGVVVTVLVYLLWATLLVATLASIGSGGAGAAQLNTQDPAVQTFLVLGALPLIVWILRAMTYAGQRANGVRMSPTQFPEGYRMVVAAAAQFGLRKVPDAYVVSGSGVINAFASGHGFRRFVAINSDLFEIGGRVRDPEALRFVISHEVGHIAAGHVSYLRLVFTNLLSTLPILGAAYSRAQEYTADNFGYARAPEAAPGVIAVLAGGKYLNADVNVFEMADRAATERGLWVHIANWRSSHPVLTWRAHALMDRSRPGRIFLRPRDAFFSSPLPAGSDRTDRWPTPPQVLAMLDAADAERDPALGEQFGRYPGVDYAGRPTAREIQTAQPLLSERRTLPPA